MPTKKLIDFFAHDKQLNEDFNADVDDACDSLSEAERRMLVNLILDYSKKVPVWDYSAALQVLNIADMQLQHQVILGQIKRKDEKNPVSRGDTDTLNNLMNAINKAQQMLGIDPKSLASKGDGSLNESFSSVVSRMSFNQKRTVFKPIYGLKDRGQGPDTGQADRFKDMDDAAVEKYLESAAAE